MKMSRFCTPLLALILLSLMPGKTFSQVQSYYVTGQLLDLSTGKPLSYGEIIIEENKRGALTDSQGRFIVKLEPGDNVLLFRYLGYNDKLISLSLYSDTTLGISLERHSHEIDEVEIVYSIPEQDPLTIGRPIENIGKNIVNTLNTNDVNDAIHGRIPGVWVSKVSGAPGDHNRIHIRGINSIFGNPDPLYIVDGMIVPVVNSMSTGIADLSSKDVENISILKDASSTALYGFLGGNGVILIETKKGSKEPEFEFSYKQGVQIQSNRYPYLDAETFLSTIDSSDKILRTRFYLYSPNNGIMPKFPRYLDDSGNPIGSDDFQSMLFRTGSLSEYHLSGSGELGKTRIFISGNYYTHKGVVLSSDLRKINLNASLFRQFSDRLHLRMVYRTSNQIQNNTVDGYMGNTFIFKGINYDPCFRYTPDSIRMQGGRIFLENAGDGPNRSFLRLYSPGPVPEALFNEFMRSKKDVNHYGIMDGTFQAGDNWQISAAASISKRNMIYQSYLPYAGLTGNTLKQQYLYSLEEIISSNQMLKISHNNDLGAHHLKSSLIIRNYRDNANWNADSSYAVDSPFLGPDHDIYLRGSQALYGDKGAVNRRISSVVFNVNYNFKSKYFVSGIMNFENLKEGEYVRRNCLFSSIAFNWEISNEAFLSNVSWISDFKLYLNWGQAGNYPLNSLSNDLYRTNYLYYGGSQFQQGAGIDNLANHHLKHEEVEEINLGARLQLFRRRLGISIDIYQKDYTDLLVYRDIPFHFGGGIFLDNIGEMRNRGLEFRLELIPLQLSRLLWEMEIGYSRNNQDIISLKDGIPIEFISNDPLIPEFYVNVDDELGEFMAYEYLGKWKELPEDQRSSPFVVHHKGLAYTKVDTTSSVLTSADKVSVGNSLPTFTGSWINHLRMGRFSLDMHWYGVFGVDKYNSTRAATYITGNNPGLREMVLDTIQGIRDTEFYESSFFVEDASFIRLKTISLTFVPKQLIRGRVGMEFRLSCENLVTLTRYKGYDPEASIYTNNHFSDNAIDWGAYPASRGYFASITLRF